MSVNNLKKGINIDISPQQQPEGTYRYAMNAVMEARDGRLMDVSNEDSNQLRFTLPDGYEPRGWVYKKDNTFYVFSNRGIDSEIGYVDKNWNYTTLINNSCLNFQRRIDAIYRLRRGCEDVVYFTDGLNPVRTINFSDLDQYYVDGEFDCDLIRLDRDYEFPTLDVEVIDSGGRLKLGTYRVFIQYLDDQFNTTNFVWEAAPVRIYDENTNDPYDEIDGGFNLDSDPQNGVAIATKSIRVTVNNLDTKFSYYRIGLAVADSGEGTVNNFLISPEISIDSEVYTITGDYSDYIAGSLEEFLIGKLRVDRADHIEQIDNRLILGNTKSGEAELCELQKYASKIKTKALSNRYPLRSPTGSDGKNPDSVEMTFLGDEIYALGIVYTKPGYETPVYHIPGRPARLLPDGTPAPLGDIDILEQWDQIMSYKYSEGEYNALPQGDKFRRFEVFNTAFQTKSEEITVQAGTNLLSISPAEYRMGYHESKEVYPDIEDCNGNSIWGVDSEGNELVGTPIRHHRIPSRTLIPLIQDTPPPLQGGEKGLMGISIEFENIQLPPGYTGYYFVAGKRDQFNRTIWDTGLAFNQPFSNSPEDLNANLGIYITAFLGGTGFQPSNFRIPITPKLAFNIEYPQSDFIAFYNLLNYEQSTAFQDGDFTNPENDNSVIGSWNLDVILRLYKDGESPLVSGTAFKAGSFLQRLEGSTSTGTNFATDLPVPAFFDNLNFIRTREVMQPAHFLLQTDYTHEPDDYKDGRVEYFAFKVQRDIFNNLFSIRYRPITNINENVSSVGDVFISFLGYPLANLPDEITGSSDVRLRGHYYGFWCESELDTNLRNGSITNDCGEYLQLTDIQSDNSKRKANQFFYNKRYDVANDEERDCPDYYALNPDFNLLGSLSTKLPIAREYDCCSDCDEVFKTRLLYSEQSFQEERSDHYRTFLPNNYRDIPGEKGDITNIFKFNDNLYVHTPEGLWQQPRSYQERVNADGTLSYLGTGSFFEQPPRIVFDAIGGAGGCVDKWSLVKSKSGIMWVDALSGEVYTMSDKINAASNAGMRTFFQENLKSHLKDLFLENGVEYNEPYADIISTYDPRFERYIITKLDYKPLRPVKFVTPFFKDWEKGVLYYNIQRNEWFTYKPGTFVSFNRIQLGDPNFFENKSWTISYHPGGFFISFHSYLPLMYAHNNDTFISFKDNGAWSHDGNGTQNFFGEYYPHIIEPVHTSGLQTSITDSFMLQAEFRSGELILQDVFFDEAILYNTRQCSGNVPLRLKTKGVNYLYEQAANQGIPVRNRENQYTLNHFRDLVVNTNEYFFTNEWNQLKDQFPIDKVINNNVFSDKSYMQKERFRDKYVIGRFIKYGGNDIKITTRFIINMERTLPVGARSNKEE